jgi:hypothetical protein
MILALSPEPPGAGKLRKRFLILCPNPDDDEKLVPKNAANAVTVERKNN